MKRAFLFVLDSVGIGGAPDAARYGDEGANTVGHIALAAARGEADFGRNGSLRLPNLERLGLGLAARSADPTLAHLWDVIEPDGFYGTAREVSAGKDTPSGHWEIAGLPVPFDWGYFPKTVPTFPTSLTNQIIEQAKLPGILANCHASGTEVIARFGEEHIKTGKPICYTSADSVFQIAAHESHFGLERLYELCALVRKLVDDMNIGRVIARPFVGERIDEFQRTANRRDYAVPPAEPTVLDRLVERGSKVIAVGKIGDIFAHQGISEVRKAPDNMAMFDAALAAMDDARDGELVFVNFVDFDMVYGHRRDVPGYAKALEDFDRRLPEALAKLQDGDLLILTADHGCDPSWEGTEHTREQVPIVGAGPGFKPKDIGQRASFADIGETVAEHLGLEAGPYGTSFYSMIADA